MMFRQSKLFSILKSLYLAVALAFWPCACLLPLFFEDSGGGEALAYLLYYAVMLPVVLLPCYLAYMELGAFVGRLIDGQPRPLGERILGFITPALALLMVLGMIATMLDTPSLRILTMMFPLAAIALVVLWIVGAIKYNKRPCIRKRFGPKGVRVTAICLIILFLAVGFAIWHLHDMGYYWTRSYGWYNTSDPLLDPTIKA